MFVTHRLSPRVNGVRPAKKELIWSSRAAKTMNTDFGPRRLWHETQRLYSIVQFPESTGEFIALIGKQVISRKRSLSRAKRACLTDFVSRNGASFQ